MGKKTDNQNLEAKLALRRHFLERYHRDRPPRVMDCCAGSGLIWSELSREHDIEYWGIDQKPSRGRLAIDSVRILEQQGWEADIVDIDTYGSPWKHYFALLRTMPDACTIFLTVGLIRMGGGSGLPREVGEALGLDLQVPPAIAAQLQADCVQDLLAHHHDHSIKSVEAQEADSGRNARYIGIRLSRSDLSCKSLQSMTHSTKRTRTRTRKEK